MPRFACLPGLALAAAACCPAPPAAAPAADPAAEKAAIRRVVAGMEDAWNRGDFAGYMAAFKKPDVVFVSRGEFQKDWQGTLDHDQVRSAPHCAALSGGQGDLIIVRDYGGDPKRRGKLHFFDLRIDIISADSAMLIGRYRLEGGGRPQDGINTRLFRKVGGKWVIAMNHVSSRT